MSTLSETPSMERKCGGSSHHPHSKGHPSHPCIVSGNVARRSHIQSVDREAASVNWSITLPLPEDEAMTHLSAHSQRVTLAAEHQNQRMSRRSVQSSLFLEHGVNVAMAKLDNIRHQDVQR